MTADHSIVAEHYADAVMQLAANTGADKSILEDLRGINQVLKQSPDFEIVLKHPAVNPADKKELIKSAFGGRVHELTLRLLELLADRRRLSILPFIEKAYETLWRERNNIVVGTLVYAEKPDARIIEDIRKTLETKLGKKVELSAKEDKSLIGGYTLKLGDRVVDGSLKGRLQQLEKQLLSV